MSERVLKVYLDPKTGLLAWKLAGTRGARWHSGRKDIYQCSKEAQDGGLEPPFIIDYVDKKD